MIKIELIVSTQVVMTMSLEDAKFLRTLTQNSLVENESDSVAAGRERV